MAQLKKLLDIHENNIIKISTNRIENLEWKITSMQEENKQLGGEVKSMHELIEYMKWNIRGNEKRQDGRETKIRNW